VSFHITLSTPKLRLTYLLPQSVASQDSHRAQWINDLQDQIGAFLMDPNSLSWLGLPTTGEPQDKMLDYACGDGLPSRTLKPHFKTCIGVDVSAGMLAKYNATATRLALGPEEMIAVRGDLFAEPVEPTDPPLPEELLQNFDLAAICMALHHMEDIQLAISKLAERLRPGGTLLVIDWAQITGSTAAQKQFMEDVETGKIATKGLQQNVNAHGHHHHHHQNHQTEQHQYVHPEKPWKPHPASHTITHDSFTEDQMAELFRNSGCTEVRWKLADRLSDVPGARTGKMQLFWARATKGE
jgi:ubiquinone/menaquinone biosynthesis C-methylase UbiE